MQISLTPIEMPWNCFGGAAFFLNYYYCMMIPITVEPLWIFPCACVKSNKIGNCDYVTKIMKYSYILYCLLYLMRLRSGFLHHWTNNDSSSQEVDSLIRWFVVKKIFSIRSVRSRLALSPTNQRMSFWLIANISPKSWQSGNEGNNQSN